MAPTSHPSKENGGTHERGTDAYPVLARDNAVMSDQWSASPPSTPALRGHPRRCATIPSTAAPSPTLWEPETTGHRHTRCCASTGPPSVAPSSQRTEGDQMIVPTRPPSKPPLGRNRTRHNTRDGSKICLDDHQFHDTVHHTAICSLITVRYGCKPPPLGL
jgi:hypothetical protein